MIFLSGWGIGFKKMGDKGVNTKYVFPWMEMFSATGFLP